MNVLNYNQPAHCSSLIASSSSLLLLFIDGLGIGTRGTHNPFDGLDGAEPLAVFQNEDSKPILNGILVPTDATLGVEGRPQSASGQTTILTGINAPLALGYHKQGFPNEALREIIQSKSIFLQLKLLGIGPNIFANAYTPRFFEERPRWVSATTVAVEAAGLSFLTLDNLRVGEAVYQDFTNSQLIERGEEIELIEAEEAAGNLARIVKKNRFTLYEYFITDRIGHAQDMDAARITILRLARFVRSLLDKIDLDITTVILTSDHGNIEDLSSRNHTLNSVPTIIWGQQREQIAERISSLADITPSIVEALSCMSAKR
jgi:2,3-bisphosphoglycerate-independent phosphoglycerate mutase